MERNGRHFIHGFAGRTAEAKACLAAHPDLYHREGSQVRLRITCGRLAIGSLACSELSAAALPALAVDGADVLCGVATGAPQPSENLSGSTFG